jgi:hypothetical protein
VVDKLRDETAARRVRLEKAVEVRRKDIMKIDMKVDDFGEDESKPATSTSKGVGQRIHYQISSPIERSVL